MANERTTCVTTSQVKCFKQCRKRYELEYVEELKPIETPKPLAIGSLYHMGLESLLRGMSLDDALGCMVDAAMFQSATNDIDWDPTDLYVAEEMVIHWHNESGYKTWETLDVERSFEVSLGYGKRLRGKLDGIRRKDGKLLIVEHKSTSTWGQTGEEYLNGLQWDEQSTNYLYACAELAKRGDLESVPSGVAYDIIEKPTIRKFTATPVADRKYTKDGRLYAAQHDHDETAEEFRARVHAWYAEKPRLHEAFIYRTADKIAAAMDDLRLTMKDLAAAEKEGTFYRNPAACSILACPYAPKCLENAPDTDCLFVKKIKKNEELG